MKRMISIILAAVLCMSMLAGCSADTATETTAANEAQNIETLEGKEVLDGKKIIFFGNSHTYYGKCVLEKGQDVYGLDWRKNDQGYFYQICKANGLDVNVTNFTFGAHQLKDFYSGSCAAGRGHDGLNHLEYLTDRNYDYVVFQNGKGSMNASNILDECRPLMALFLEENPNTKFVFIVHDQVHLKNYAWRASVKELEAAGITIVDWGMLICDIIDGKTPVPGATQEYSKNSFIISKSESDGFHPNVLTGYITALMTYCAITGESAVGQDYSFCGDSSVNTAFNFMSFRAKQYTYDPETNFDAIFDSESDMNGLQQLIDKYLAEKGYQNY